MTNDEIILAQKEDINTLIKALRFRDATIASLNKRSYIRKYEYNTPYFRIINYGIRVYALVNIEEQKWESGDIYVTYRFHDLFGFCLKEPAFGSFNGSWGGRCSLRTCITYEELMKKLERRARINYKNKGIEYAKLIQDLKEELMKYKNWFPDFNKEEATNG